MLDYKAIEVFTSEQARYRNQPVVDAVLEFVRKLKIAARCTVTRGIAGCYENGETTTRSLEVLSYNLPINIYIVVPAAESERVLSGLEAMIDDGIIALHDLQVIRHRVRNEFFPRQLRVRDAMTPEPRSVRADSPLSETAGLLLSSIFTGLPVIDDQNRPIGVITQGDLIDRGQMPLRLGLLAESDDHRRTAVLNRLGARRAREVMSSPAVTIAADRPLSEAVDVMLARGVKRLPVVDSAGHLSGMLSRLDIFRTVMREAPDWSTFHAQKIEVARLLRVRDILRRDTITVLPETSLEDVIRVIGHNDIQRVAVVDAAGKLMGLISDRDLLRCFKQEQEGIWHLFSKLKQSLRQEAAPSELTRCLAATQAAMVMRTDLVTVREETLIGDAIALMTEKALKRLPVVDETGRFKGMISRDSLLRTGFGAVV